MIQHIWTVPCRVSLTDQESNNISMIEVLEEITLAPLAAKTDPPRPKIPAIFDVVTLWVRGEPEVPEKGQGRVLLLSPKEETLIEQFVDVDLSEAKRLRTFGKILGFPVRGAGTYHFRIDRRADESSEWEVVGRVPLDVAIDPGLEQPTTTGETTQ